MGEAIRRRFCSQVVHDGTRADWGGHGCSKPAKPEYDHGGKQYCKMHFPPNAERRKKKLEAKREADRKKRQRHYDVLAARDRVVEAAIEHKKRRELNEEHGGISCDCGVCVAVRAYLALEAGEPKEGA